MRDEQDGPANGPPGEAVVSTAHAAPRCDGTLDTKHQNPAHKPTPPTKETHDHRRVTPAAVVATSRRKRDGSNDTRKDVDLYVLRRGVVRAATLRTARPTMSTLGTRT